tara:strand:+ start:840 stop:1499 length:660 start_codon:yes stop_codon:yes gene_type:complete
MAIIGTLGGASTQTVLTLAFCPEYLIVDNTYGSTFNLDALSVSVSGVSTIDISGENCINAVSNVQAQPSSEDGTLMSAIKLADGQLPDQPTLIRLTTTASGGTENIYGVSTGEGKKPYFWSNFTITQSSSQSFQDFEHLLVGNNANVQDCSVNFVSGYSDKFETVEFPVLFKEIYASADDANLDNNGSFAWLPAAENGIGSADVFTNSSGSVTCAICRY